MNASNAALKPLIESFAQASGNAEKATALLSLGNEMMAREVGFPELRKAFPHSAIDQSVTQLNALVTTFTDQAGRYYMPDGTRSRLTTDAIGFVAFNHWGKFFVDINYTALERKVDNIYDGLSLKKKVGSIGAELINKPSLLYKAIQKLNTIWPLPRP